MAAAALTHKDTPMEGPLSAVRPELGGLGPKGPAVLLAETSLRTGWAIQ